MLLVLIVLASGAAASELVKVFPDASVSYVARAKMTGGPMPVNIEVHYRPGSDACPKAYRLDIAAILPDARERPSLIVVDRDGPEASWSGFPGYQTYSVHSGDASFPFNEQGIEFRLEGTEVVAGYSTRRFGIYGPTSNGERTGRIWLTKDDVPVRMVGSSRSGDVAEELRWDLIEIRDVSCRVFEPPEGYRRIQPTREPTPE